jgi:hypothetical protein
MQYLEKEGFHNSHQNRRKEVGADDYSGKRHGGV